MLPEQAKCEQLLFGCSCQKVLMIGEEQPRSAVRQHGEYLKVSPCADCSVCGQCCLRTHIAAAPIAQVDQRVAEHGVHG
jgi:hypothetical protein